MGRTKVIWASSISGGASDPPSVLAPLIVAAVVAIVASVNLWRVRTGSRSVRRRGRQLSDAMLGRLGATVVPVFVGSWALFSGLCLVGLAFRFEAKLLAFAACRWSRCSPSLGSSRSRSLPRRVDGTLDRGGWRKPVVETIRPKVASVGG